GEREFHRVLPVEEDAPVRRAGSRPLRPPLVDRRSARPSAGAGTGPGLVAAVASGVLAGIGARAGAARAGLPIAGGLVAGVPIAGVPIAGVLIVRHASSSASRAAPC